MSPQLRKAALTVHVLSSVGWLGAVVTFLALAIAGLNSPHPQLVRAAYLGMDLIGWAVIFPLSLASLLSGIIQALGTVWGLFRHYWVLFKLVLTTLATALLLLHLQPVGWVADRASTMDLAPTDMAGLRVQLVGDAAAAVVVLLVATVLSIYKPRGLTPYGYNRANKPVGGRSAMVPPPSPE
jgi:hypothetical protein